MRRYPVGAPIGPDYPMDSALECSLDAFLQAFQQVGVAFEHVHLGDVDGRV